MKKMKLDQKPQKNIIRPNFRPNEITENSIIPLSTFYYLKQKDNFKLNILKSKAKIFNLKLSNDFSEAKNFKFNLQKILKNKFEELETNSESKLNFPHFSIEDEQKYELKREKLIETVQYSKEKQEEFYSPYKDLIMNRDKVLVCSVKDFNETIKKFVGDCKFCGKNFSSSQQNTKEKNTKETVKENIKEKKIILSITHREKYKYCCSVLQILSTENNTHKLLLQPQDHIGTFFICFVENVPKEEILKQKILVEITNEIPQKTELLFSCSCVNSKNVNKNIKSAVKFSEIQNSEKLENFFLNKNFFKNKKFLIAKKLKFLVNKNKTISETDQALNNYLEEYEIEETLSPNIKIQFDLSAEPFFDYKKMENLSEIDKKVYEINEKNRNSQQPKEEREDLTNILTFSIDPITCEDIDDAASLIVQNNVEENLISEIIKKSKNEKILKILNENIFHVQSSLYSNTQDNINNNINNYNNNLKKNILNLYIHISDASSFIKKDSELDLIALNRGTSIYSQNRRVDMIPRAFSSDICSLIPGKERRAVTVIFKILEDEENKTYKFLDVEYKNSTIKNNLKLSYEAAQQILSENINNNNNFNNFICGNQNCFTNNKNKNNTSEFKNEKYMTDFCLYCVSGTNLNTEEIMKPLLQKLMSFTKCLNNKRAENGALFLNLFSEFDTHNLIEELMLLANTAVAIKNYSTKPHQTVLRSHERIKDEQDIINNTKINTNTNINNTNINTNNNTNINTNNINNIKELIQFINTTNSMTQSLKELITFKIRFALALAKYNTAKTLEKFTPKEIKIFETPKIETTKILELKEKKFFWEEKKGAKKYLGFFHYGLATEYYTHFTSPIRRYSDILVHRTLKNIITANINNNIDNNINDNNSDYSNSRLQKICDCLNKKGLEAKKMSFGTDVYFEYNTINKDSTILKGYCFDEFEKDGYKKGKRIYLSDYKISAVCFEEKIELYNSYNFVLGDKSLIYYIGHIQVYIKH